MKLFESIVSKFGPDRINNLSAEEEQALQVALRGVRDGWVSRTNRTRVKEAGLSSELIADLESGRAPRQRAALNNPALKAYLRTEEWRWAALKSMEYFRRREHSFDHLAISEVASAVKNDSNFYLRDSFVQDTDDGRSFRRLVLFASGKDDDVLFVLAHFCRLFVNTLTSLMQKYEPVDDEKLRGELLRSVASIGSRLSDSALQRVINVLERVAECTEPKTIAPYLDILRGPDWRERFVVAQQEGKRIMAAEQAALAAERERAASAEAARLAEVKRQQQEEQLTFYITDECLDISHHDWPKLESDDDARELLANMQIAFAEARMVRTKSCSKKPEFRDVRSIVSMSAKQLACVKIEFWKSRSGLYADFASSNLPDNRMFALLNCDVGKKIADDMSLSLYPLATAGLDIELEREWSNNLDFLQKWIDHEGLKGDLVRWFVEDRDNSNGWATSR